VISLLIPNVPKEAVSPGRHLITIIDDYQDYRSGLLGGGKSCAATVQ
jgi:hypothetical protein